MSLKEHLYFNRIDVDRVIDGDTIVVWIDVGYGAKLHKIIRLAEVDTPEMFGRNAVPAGRVARDYTVKWLQAAGTDRWSELLYFHSLYYNPTDKYGRTLGRIFLDIPNQPCLNYDLVEDGHSKAVTLARQLRSRKPLDPSKGFV